MKYALAPMLFYRHSVAPARERGLKSYNISAKAVNGEVAPARERGLKFSEPRIEKRLIRGRSREGAWIEILLSAVVHEREPGRSREGAWIEIIVIAHLVYPCKSLPRGSVD